MKKTNAKKVDQNRVSVQAGTIVKFGLDVHADQITVRRQFDGQVAQPAQQQTWDRAIEWMDEHVKKGAKVYSCYEAGPCGYGLHRQLEKMGVINYVIAPQRWDRSGSRIKTDSRDATEMSVRLDQYLRGDTTAFSVVRVPTAEQEQRRSLCRHRGQLVKERQRSVVRGCALMLAQGIKALPDWWTPKQWAEQEKVVPEWLREQLLQWQNLAVQLDEKIDLLTPRIEQLSEGAGLIKGYGKLTHAVVEAEILDWSRFKNRRQIGSFTGLCPSEHSTGHSRRQGSINKHGNPRIRHQLVEAVWRLLYWQNNYKPLNALRAAKGSRARKRAAVAAARHLAIDLWRINTQQCTPQSLGLVVAE